MINQNSFVDIAQQAGITWSEARGFEAFSLNWLDYNDDGLEDLFVSGHGYFVPTTINPEGKKPSLYINNGDGTFTNIFEDFTVKNNGDLHGTNWQDIDNDGDLDLFVVGGGNLGGNDVDANLLYINDNGVLREQAGEKNLRFKIGRGRSALWFDSNNDGLLDVLQLNGLREDGLGKTTFFRQNADGTFTNARVEVGLNFNEPARSAQLADLTGDGKLDLVIQGTYSFPLKVYDISTGLFQDITNQFPILSDPPAEPTQDFIDHQAARDFAIADFNNDLRPDIFMTRSSTKQQGSSLVQTSGKMLAADLFLNSGDGINDIGFRLQTNGNLALDTFDVNGLVANLNVNQIFIGASGRNPTAAELAAITQFASPNSSALQTVNSDRAGLVLNPNDASVFGLTTPDPATKGLYIGYNFFSQTWQVRLVSPNRERLRLVVESTEQINNTNTIGFTTVDPNVNRLSDRLWLYDSATDQYQDSSIASGITALTSAQSVVAGDFDNDMDVDLYLANAYASFNQPNIFYDNQGDGSFIPVEVSGAEGTAIGPHILDFDIGQRLAVADFDNNGFLDIFAGSLTSRSRDRTYLGEAPQLFQNQGNNNNWIQFKLEGTTSNRDAVGARVILTTPDGTSQLREQNGGNHLFGQNSQRIHFGLGQNNQIENLRVEWPSGATQEFSNVAINQILTITEGQDIPPQPNPEPDPDIIGTANDDQLTGTNSQDYILGEDGDDTIKGLDGADTILGEAGADSLNGGNGKDFLDGGAFGDTLVGGEGADTLVGGLGKDLIFGQGGQDVLQGGAGDDTLRGGNGDDTLQGGAGIDVAKESFNGDILLTNTSLIARGTDILEDIEIANVFAGSSHNFVDASAVTRMQVILNGSGGRDTLVGGTQDDTLIGGVGVDLLTGGEGSDVFFYKAINHRNDRITDFDVAKDIMIFSRAGFGEELTSGQFLNEDQFAIGLGTTDASDRFIYNPNNGNVFFDADGSGSGRELLITTLTNTPNLSHRDIFIVN
ncbi:hypothetical protein,putative calcium-binding protein [Xenococcus sp. PCC 7305]|uniref:CRTAC homolog protein n=1 Tax=Xenococcus sp. PCC 7305 TaxID=102125 RepID=UPI0002AC69F5|nr:CRTAC homolog protein [Xenococcus sp. PCC 7305]ELS00355.1 hypothetical protein,putative calcium-binding protein [Xenococcus sp. PCC 7305]